MTKRSPGLVALVLALSVPTMAQAHLMNSGLGPFYDGALHLVASPMDVVRLGTLCLFAGSQGLVAARASALAAPVAWSMAGVLAILLGATARLDLVHAVALILIGSVVALNLKLPVLATVAITACIAGLLGFQSGIDLASDDAGWLALSGAACVTLAIVLLTLSFVVSARSFPARVVCRALGSWASATGLLSLGWIFAMPR